VGRFASLHYFFTPKTPSFAALATRNLTTVFAGILMDLLQFPGDHEHQRTKVSRWNQWENGSTGGMIAPPWPFCSDQSDKISQRELI